MEKTITLDVQFDNIISSYCKISKYNCFVWNIKSLLEFFGVVNGDLYCGKQLGFYYNEQTGDITVGHYSLEFDLSYFHGIQLTCITEKGPQDVLDQVHCKLYAGMPVCVSAFTIPLVFVEEGFNSNIREELEDFRYRTTLITGYDENQKMYQITEPIFRISDNDGSLFIEHFKGWFNRERMLEAINSDNLPIRNSWFELKCPKESLSFGPTACEQVIRWNVHMMTVSARSKPIFRGMKGIKKFSKFLEEFLDIQNKEKFGRWYFQLLNVIQQRLAYIDFLDSAQLIVQKDYSMACDRLIDICHNWEIVRKLCLKVYRRPSHTSVKRIHAVVNRLEEMERDLSWILTLVRSRSPRPMGVVKGTG